MANSAVAGLHLSVTRGDAAVLADLTFSIGTGRVTGLLGPSGSGKTTLLRCILGLQRIASGRIDVFGVPSGHPSLRTRIGYASQSASIYEDITVAENLRYFARVLGAAPGDVDRVIEAVDLGRFAGRIAGRLSGGQRSRVSLAAAMLGHPDLLVLDEPTVGLDPVLREQLWQLFHSLTAAGTTLLVSSHVMDEAERCDQLLLLRDGTIVAQHSPQELRELTGAATMDDAFLRLIRTEPAPA